jgi:hypothetical protein
MNKFVSVKPISKKAKNRFANCMNNCDICEIEQQNGTKLFLAAIEGEYFFWVDVNNSTDWQIEI